MIEETKIKAHLIVTDIHEEYFVNWCGKLFDAKPVLKNEKPVFVIISSEKRIELNTSNITEVERAAKAITTPHGRAARTTDKAYVYLKEVGDKERLVCIVTHDHVKKYAPMFDKVYRC